MFAGMPGTGIGALFFALVCLLIGLCRGIRQCSWTTQLSAVWILLCVLLVYGSGVQYWLADGSAGLAFAWTPLVLLGAVLGASTLIGRARRGR